MASTTKIMTALVTLQNAKLTDRYTVPPLADAVEGSSGALEEGETLTVRQLLTALLVPSGNDAAITLAQGVGGSQAAFVAMMNATAERLGLDRTHYANPHGLDAPGHHSSVANMVTLAEAAMRDRVFRGIVSSRRASIAGPGGVGVRRYESENELLDIDPEADGIKTGMTDGAGYALVGHARRAALGVELYVAIIGAPSSGARARGAKELPRLWLRAVRERRADPRRHGVRARPGGRSLRSRGPLCGGFGAARADPHRTAGHRDRDRAHRGRRARRGGSAHRHRDPAPGRARAGHPRPRGHRVGGRTGHVGPPAGGTRGADPVIVTVTLNAALDRTVRVPNFQIGARHRADASLRQPGGKGVNVARALKLLGQPVIATGLAGGRVGTYIIEELTAEGILNDFVRIADESRTSTAVIDPTNSQQTEINEYGPSVQAAELDVLFDTVRYLSKGADVFVLAGSLPRDVPVDLYERLLRAVRREGMITALDASGPALRAALAAEPDVVSPNVREAEEIVGHEFGDEDDMVAAAEMLTQMGAETALIHHEDGCVAHSRAEGKRGRTYRARLSRRTDVVSTVGSGDALLAGYLSARYGHQSPEHALALAVACGAANTQRFGAGVFDPADVESLMRRVEIVSDE